MSKGPLRYYEDGFRKLVPDFSGYKYIVCRIDTASNAIIFNYDLGDHDHITEVTFASLNEAWETFSKLTIIEIIDLMHKETERLLNDENILNSLSGR